MQFEINFLKAFCETHKFATKPNLRSFGWKLFCVRMHRVSSPASYSPQSRIYGRVWKFQLLSSKINIFKLECFMFLCTRGWVFENSLSAQHTRRAWTSRCSTNYFPMNINSIFRSDFWAIKLILEIPLKYCPSIITRGGSKSVPIWIMESSSMENVAKSLSAGRLDMIYSKIEICCWLIIAQRPARLQCNDLAVSTENSFSQIDWKLFLIHSEWSVIDRDTPHVAQLEEMSSASYVRKCRGENCQHAIKPITYQLLIHELLPWLR